MIARTGALSSLSPNVYSSSHAAANSVSICTRREAVIGTPSTACRSRSTANQRSRTRRARSLVHPLVGFVVLHLFPDLVVLGVVGAVGEELVALVVVVAPRVVHDCSSIHFEWSSSR